MTVGNVEGMKASRLAPLPALLPHQRHSPKCHVDCWPWGNCSTKAPCHAGGAWAGQKWARRMTDTSKQSMNALSNTHQVATNCPMCPAMQLPARLRTPSYTICAYIS